MNYFENFDPGWKVVGTPTLLHYRTNGFINAYVCEWSQVGRGVYAFGPDDWISRGRIASTLVLFLTVLGLVLFLVREKLRSVPPSLFGKGR
jgi:hypothetical protein